MPWARFLKQWVLYALVMLAFMFVFYRDRGLTGVVIGLAASLPVYLAFAGILAKFGYVPKTLKDLRAQSGREAAGAVAATPPAARPKPAPTKRTGGGRRPPHKGRKR